MPRWILLLVLTLFVVTTTTLYTVDETEQIVVTQFGEYRRTVDAPGLHVKIPVLEDVLRFEKRIIASDAVPAKYLTRDKKRVVIDHLTRWRIADPLVFFKSAHNEVGARARIDDIVFSEMRRELASHPFAKIISVERGPIMETVTGRAREKTAQFGIEIIDVTIKRADLPEEVQESVFARMRAEREREAKRYRSEGEEEVAKIRAETDKERTIILAKAYEESQRLRGEGDAEATRVYAEAYGPEADFYSFLRRLEAYEQIMNGKDTVVLSTESELFRYLSGASGDGPADGQR
jgi:membrane protease subunit HflC